jgi:hypothetical protein
MGLSGPNLGSTFWMPPSKQGWVWFSINLPMDFRRFSMEFREGLLSSRFSLPMATSLRGRPWRSGLQTADRWGPEWPVIFKNHTESRDLSRRNPKVAAPMFAVASSWLAAASMTHGWRSELTNVSKSGCGKSFTLAYSNKKGYPFNLCGKHHRSILEILLSIFCGGYYCRLILIVGLDLGWWFIGPLKQWRDFAVASLMINSQWTISPKVFERLKHLNGSKWSNYIGTLYISLGLTPDLPAQLPNPCCEVCPITQKSLRLEECQADPEMKKRQCRGGIEASQTSWIIAG